MAQIPAGEVKNLVGTKVVDGECAGDGSEGNKEKT